MPIFVAMNSYQKSLEDSVQKGRNVFVADTARLSTAYARRGLLR